MGGLLLSFTLFLTISFHSSPYYTGADIVFSFAWLPLILAGSGGVVSIDAVEAWWSSAERELGSPTMVPVAFSVIQNVCGNYDRDRCRALRKAPCDILRCPFLADERINVLRRGPDDIDRRQVVLGGMAAVGAGVLGLVAAGAVAAIGRAIVGASTPEPGAVVLPGAVKHAATNTSTTSPSASTTPSTRASGTTRPRPLAEPRGRQ